MESMLSEFLVVCCIMIIGSLAPYWVSPALEVIDVVIEKIYLITKIIKAIKPKPHLYPQPENLKEWIL